MTCREFKHAAASMTLWELARSDDQQLFAHAVECAGCAVWLDQQQMLAAGMQVLQARTAGREAGPQVERALLRIFRQVPFEATQSVAAHRSAPIAFRLSRFFEIGAYVAVAAAIVVGVFLGVRLLEQPSAKGPVQSQSGLAVTAPVQKVQTAGDTSQQEVAPVMRERPAMPVKREVAAHTVSQSSRTMHSGSAAASQIVEDPDYVALMFCDPLICSSDAQVVRMELPVPGASDRDAQTQIADVVVGDDGLVRAMRIVN
jgi:hypothetical protein